MVLKLSNVEKKLSNYFTLKIDTASMTSGKIYGIVGNNGAGKTTMLSVICGLRKIDKGTILIDTQRLNKKNQDWWKSLMGVYLDESFMFDYYTVFEHFRFVSSAWNISKADLENRVKKYEGIFKLNSFFGHRISSLSTGNRKKVGLMATLLIEPDILIWDEPFNGLDPIGQELLKKQLVQYINSKESIVLISSHDLNHIAEICDEVVILDQGKIVTHFDGNISYDRLREAFLESTGIFEELIKES